MTSQSLPTKIVPDSKFAGTVLKSEWNTRVRPHQERRKEETVDRWGQKAWKSSRFAGDMERFVDDVLSEVPARIMRRRPAMDLYETHDT